MPCLLYVVHLGILTILGRIVAPAMSHNAVIDRGAAQEILRDIMSASSKPERPRAATIGTNHSQPFGTVISPGRLGCDYAKMCLGEEAMSHMVQGEQKASLPRGCWPA